MLLAIPSSCIWRSITTVHTNSLLLFTRIINVHISSHKLGRTGLLQQACRSQVVQKKRPLHKMSHEVYQQPPSTPPNIQFDACKFTCMCMCRYMCMCLFELEVSRFARWPRKKRGVNEAASNLVSRRRHQKSTWRRLWASKPARTKRRRGLRQSLGSVWANQGALFRRLEQVWTAAKVYLQASYRPLNFSTGWRLRFQMSQRTFLMDCLNEITIH